MEQTPPRSHLRGQTRAWTEARVSVSHTGSRTDSAPPASKRRVRSGPNLHSGETHHCVRRPLCPRPQLVHDSAKVCSLVLFPGRLPWNKHPHEVTYGGKLGRGPRREFQSPIRGRGRIPRHQRQNAEYGPGQTCIRAKRTTACDGLCARDRNLYTIPRKCAASSCSLGVCAPTPGWELPWNKHPHEVTYGGKLGRGPRREFQSPIRGRGRIPRHQRQNAEYGPGQTCIRAKRTTACDGLCARDRNLYTIPRKCAASSCSLGVCAPTPGWELAWNKTLTH